MAEPQTIATRKASELALEVITAAVPELVLGSADLTPSNNTKTKNLTVGVTPGDYSGRYIHYGIREHGMAAAMNGLTLHGGLVPAGATFMVFTDYCRPAIRMAALMGIRVIYVMTHDSIGLGEDGPTHQPVEHLAALRAIPNLNVFRPADPVETAECWQLALERAHDAGPAGADAAEPRARPHDGEPGQSLRAGRLRTRSRRGRRGQGGAVRLGLRDRDRHGGAQEFWPSAACRRGSCRCPAWNSSRPSPLPPHAVVGDAPVKVAVEAGIRMGWDWIIGADGVFVGMSGFGASAPYKELYAHFGITAEAVVEKALAGL